MIINTTSIQSYDPSLDLLTYATTKGVITTFTKALSDVAIKQGVRVNAVAPGPVWTPLIPSTMTYKRPLLFEKISALFFQGIIVRRVNFLFAVRIF